jgi:alpha-glucosidase
MVRPDGKPQGDAAADKHARYHNVYGMLMVMGTREGIAAANPDKRPFVLSRDNYIGGQRYAATWTGDNTASWPHLKMSIPMVLNVGLSGQPFIGPDVGGFNGMGAGDSVARGKLFARWFGFGAMFPFSRGHTGKENINKEPWAFGPEVEATCREALERRYQLLPYYYTLFHEASVTGLPVARPTFFADPADPTLRSVDDSFLLGKDVLIAANVDEHGETKHVMPKGKWREFLAPKNPDLPHLYMRPGAIVPMGPIMQFTSEKPLDTLTLIVSLDEKGDATGDLYEDSGDGYEYLRSQSLITSYTAKLEGDAVKVRLSTSQSQGKPLPRKLDVHVLTDKGELTAQGTSAEMVTVKLN